MPAGKPDIDPPCMTHNPLLTMPHVITLCYDGDLQLTCVILITCKRESVTVK